MGKLKYEPWYYEEIENPKMYKYIKNKYIDSGIEPYTYILMKFELQGQKLIVGEYYKTPNGYTAELMEIKGNYYIFGV